ncbi:class I SAM-dependent methyltransferase [Nocardia terpenica]|uniref:Methyltransferase type 11 n=1 Tax=Nocardia terpenica TaxID=455432 RepID=A0A291RCL5_9NOCA|nr:class I SAM-dependent methyltransferase [Nocardia terpenica]ATL65067.1 methyltransferase type 11 [Nocardia terpenica]
MGQDPKRVVETGYDRIAERYLGWMGEIRDDARIRFLGEVIAGLPERATVLDLGCGAGIPCTAALAEHADVVGVDLSARQLELARARVPGARFVRADIGTVDFRRASFDAVTAFYSIAHLPRAEHGALFRRIAGWLRPGGRFAASLGSGNDEGAVDDWLGAPMYFSSYDAATNRRLLGEAGLEPMIDEIVALHEPEGPAVFQWVVAAKPFG